MKNRENARVLNCIYKSLKIYAFCIAALAFQGKTEAQIINDSLYIKEYEAGEVIVTASRTAVELQQATRIVTIITRAEIERSPARSVNDLLRQVAGVDVRQRGPLGVQADISILGGTFDQTLILLNGVNVTDPQSGHHNLNLPVDIESIERIEILQGSAAKSFGPNAFSGAVNIITGNSKPNNIRLSLMRGDYGLYQVSGNISNTIGNFKHFITLNRMSSDGYINNTDFSNTNILYQASYTSGTGTIDFQTGYNTKDYGANSFYSLKYPDQFEATKTQFVSLKYQSKTKIKFAPVLYLRRNNDHFELIRNDDSVPFNNHQTRTAGLNLNVWTNHRFGRTSLGIDLRSEHIKSTLLGNPLNPPVEIPGSDKALYTNHYTRMNTSIYAEHFVSWKKLVLTAGVMTHHNSDLKGFGIYPGIDVAYRLSDNYKFYFSASKTLRMPTFTDMFYKSPVNQGNPVLKPEEAVSIEGGVKYYNSYLKGNVTLFHRRGYNMIDWVKNPSSDTVIWRSMNHTEINFTGIQSSFTLTPFKEGSFKRIESVRLSYSFLQADMSSTTLLSKYTLDYLSNQITAGFDARIAWKLYYSGRLTWQDRNGAYHDAFGQIVQYKPFWLFDSRIYWKENHFTIYTEASNLFNSTWYDFGGIIQPGVWFQGGIIVNTDYKKRIF